MGRYLKEARYDVKKIQYYYDHAGSRGYSQAKYHYFNLSDMMMRAHRSKHDKNETIIIQMLKKSVDGLMEEMRRREEAGSDQ